MKWFVLSIFIMISGFTTQVMAEDQHVAIVKTVSGSVEVVRGKTTLVATPGMQLLRQDMVISAAASKAAMIFVDGTRITLGSNSELELKEYLFEPKAAKYDFSLYVRKGEVIYASGRLGKLAPDAVNLKTPRATVGIRGTRFIVKVE